MMPVRSSRPTMSGSVPVRDRNSTALAGGRGASVLPSRVEVESRPLLRGREVGASQALTPEVASLVAIQAQLELAGQGLVDLVREQEAANETLKAVREIESFIRKLGAQETISRQDLGKLEALVSKVNGERRLGIDFSAELESMKNDLFDESGHARVGQTSSNPGDYLVAKELSSAENEKRNADQLKNMKAELSDVKDAIKGNVSQNELKLQLANQEYNNARQALSTLSHRYDEVDRAIIANFA